MEERGAGLREQRTFVRFSSQQEALIFLKGVLTDERGVALLHGRKSSGKSVLATQFVRDVQAHLAVAFVDGARMKTPELLSRILEQFGYNVALDSSDEMLGMLNVFAVQQVRSNQAPVIILENINDMYPSALNALCKLASLKTNSQYAIRFVLISDRDTGAVMQSPSMAAVADRVIGNFELGPMTPNEALHYLYAKLRSGGVEHPDDVFSVEVCEKLYALSGGLPGDLDTLALLLMDQASEFPAGRKEVVEPHIPAADVVPKLIITTAGEPPREVEITGKRMLVGRSDLSDIVIHDQFVSSQHALLVRDEDAVVLLDLKSRNGTFVNSRQVQSKVLLHSDIISLGEHRLKMVYAEGHSNVEISDPVMADTVKMKNIADARREREQEIPTLVVVANQKE